jgi:hypothetical protein
MTPGIGSGPWPIPFFCFSVVVIALVLLAIPAIYFLVISLIADRVHGVKKSSGLGGFPVLPPAMTLRFAILHHTGVTTPHYDLMFEPDPEATLATWRSPVWPVVGPVPVEQLDDHRRDYLDYEGPVSNDRGRVDRVVGGLFRFESRTADRWVIATDHGYRLTFNRQEEPAATWTVEVGQTA